MDKEKVLEKLEKWDEIYSRGGHIKLKNFIVRSLLILAVVLLVSKFVGGNNSDIYFDGAYVPSNDYEDSFYNPYTLNSNGNRIYLSDQFQSIGMDIYPGIENDVMSVSYQDKYYDIYFVNDDGKIVIDKVEEALDDGEGGTKDSTKKFVKILEKNNIGTNHYEGKSVENNSEYNEEKYNTDEYNNMDDDQYEQAYENGYFD